ncbi:MAG: hypothetical protein AVDCRST_MAG27-735, partial [uncultured Craurococcus sp.]
KPVRRSGGRELLRPSDQERRSQLRLRDRAGRPSRQHRRGAGGKPVRTSARTPRLRRGGSPERARRHPELRSGRLRL